MHDRRAMQQPLRSVRPQYNVRSGVVHRSEAVPASVPPLTPRKANELDDLIESLEDKYKLGFMTQSGLRSPATAKSKADIALKKIRYLFFSDKPALHDALARFATALTGPAKDQRLDELLRILRRKTSHESTKAKLGTPISERDVLPKTSQSCKCAFDQHFLPYTLHAYVCSRYVGRLGVTPLI